MQKVLKDGADRALALANRYGGKVWARIEAWLRWSCTIVGKTFAERIVERALKIQIGFLIFLAVIAPFGGFGMEPLVAPFLVVQAALTRLALVRVRARDPIFGAGLYMIIAVITFIEAKGYSGIVGFIFSLEAMLSLVAAYYIVMVLRVGRATKDIADRSDEGDSRAAGDAQSA
ncbi:MAG: hypothetical protein AAF577_08415 [Pseudomonadota bacterium]